MANLSEVWRVFVAIELEAELRHKISRHIQKLRDESPDARASWAREENLHLTLKFIGDTPLPKIELLSEAVQRSASVFAPFEITTGACGTFSSHGRPKVLWVGIEDPSGALSRLYQSLEDECAKAGFTREQRAFHPHLTLARLRETKGARHLGETHVQNEFQTQTIKVARLALIRSELQRSGAKYSLVSAPEFKAD